MDLILFDIDGTLVDSVKTDDECFIQTFKDLHDIDLSGADWNNFKNVTDSGLTSEIFEKNFNRQPSEEEVGKLKTHFYELLKKRIIDITEINGATTALKFLSDLADISIALATGGWRETAELKLSAIKFDSSMLTLVSANEHFTRSEIIRLAIEESLKKEQVMQFESITYIGDGLWDFRTAQTLGINFIGVDHQRNDKLLEAGASNVLNDLVNVHHIIEWVKE